MLPILHGKVSILFDFLISQPEKYGKKYHTKSHTNIKFLAALFISFFICIYLSELHVLYDLEDSLNGDRKGFEKFIMSLR